MTALDIAEAFAIAAVFALVTSGALALMAFGAAMLGL